MKYFSMFITVSVLTGCASIIPKVQWVASTEFDRFTDQTACTVTTGSLYTQSSVFTYTNHLYPFIEVVNGELRVGLKSGGKYKVPVGDVQLRIDKNKAWNISMSETPVNVKPDLQTSAQVDIMTEYAKNLPPEQQALVVNSYKAAMSSTGKMLSPYTATTGDKAKAIVKEMLKGNTLIYRTLGFNQAPTLGGSTTGEFLLDGSLEAALNKCQIKI
ncbi:MAG: hypothetical protein ACI936_002671 [Paraglaciecola sp.]|jgi:hypothetical protein